jgi:hypothetical protein
VKTPLEIDVTLMQNIAAPGKLQRNPQHHREKDVDGVAEDPLSESRQRQAIQGAQAAGFMGLKKTPAPDLDFHRDIIIDEGKT